MPVLFFLAHPRPQKVAPQLLVTECLRVALADKDKLGSFCPGIGAGCHRTLVDAGDGGWPGVVVLGGLVSPLIRRTDGRNQPVAILARLMAENRPALVDRE